MKLAIKSEI